MSRSSSLRRFSRVAVSVILASVAAQTARAAGEAWPKIEAIKFDGRVEVTMENPADVANPAATVHLALADLQKALPGAKEGQIGVIDPTTPAPKRDAADLYFVPSQVSDGKLIFSVALKPHEKKQLFVYTTATPAPFPGFAMGTGYDFRHAYHSFENMYGAFRIEAGPGSNTTGMAVDLFGKTKEGKGMRLNELYQQGHDSYHELSYWGVESLKVGYGPGLGGVYLYVGDQMGRPAYQTIVCECLYTGPVETVVKMTSPVDVGGKQFTVTRLITLVGEDRALRDEVWVEGADLTGLQLGLGVRDLPNCKWVEKFDKGIAFQTGDANQQHYKAVGLGCTFDPAEFVKMVELPDKKDFGHVYVLKGKMEGGKFVSRHKLAHIWDMDGQLPKPVNTADELTAPFASWFESWAAQRDNPVRVTVGATAEKPS